MKRFILLALLVLLLPPVSVAEAQPVPDPGSLQPGDILRIKAFRHEDLSGDYMVDERGRVILPLLGEVQVAGVSIDSLREAITSGYEAQLRDPSIMITPLRRVNVLGEVRLPGLYPLDPTVTLAGAIAVAGGATATGDLNRIRVIRGGQTIRERVGAGETLTVADIRSGDQIFVDRRSWFERNSTFVVSTMLSVTSIVIALVRRR